jgi:hypothetical protein
MFNKFRFISKYAIKKYVDKRWEFKGEQASLMTEYFSKMM